MILLRIALLAGLVIGASSLTWKIYPGKSKLVVTRKDTHFPTVSGYNLNRQEVVFPRDFGGEINLVIIAFQREQQTIVDTWIPIAQELEEKYPRLVYYELPTIYKVPAIARTFINEGMRAGIPDQTARERTITIYIDKGAFKSTMDIPNEDDIHLFLVDREGNILWRTTGAYTQDKGNQLIKVIKE